MSKLPQVTGTRLVRALKRAGFEQLRQSGSHVFVRHPGNPKRRAAIPIHGSKAVPLGTLRAILRGAGLTAGDLVELL